ncbi:MAG: methyltransferase domain-containing protein [Candidatus Krumholzibacteriota bacterium]|nr:methyltransferase domain-containing protein [Candidatus Krumholzibacteriota bacterium]
MDKMNIRPLLRGSLSFVPGIRKFLPRRGTGGTDSAEYCYEVWLKHLTLLWENGMSAIPRTLAELGPGDSIGIGLAALLSGTDHYYALDVVRYWDPGLNIGIFDRLVELFRRRAPKQPGGWPDYDRYLDHGCFPGHILTERVLRRSLSPARIAMIRRVLSDPSCAAPPIKIKYMVPWTDESIIEAESVDVIISHAVLEHVEDLDKTYQALRSWLKSAGMMSHQIDLRSHGLTKKWNGHRACPEWLWKIAKGRREYFINRQPCSVHIELLKKHGFRIICDLKAFRTDGIEREQLASSWKHLSDEDLSCSGLFIQTCKE